MSDRSNFERNIDATESSAEVASKPDRMSLLASLRDNADAHTDANDKSPGPEALGEQHAEAIKNFDGIKRWSEIGENERKDTLVQVEHTLAKLQSRPPATVEFADLGKNNYGSYRGDINTMRLNIHDVRDEQHKGPGEAVNTIAHEGRHAYQRYAIDHPGFHKDTAEVDAWRENLKVEDGKMVNYIRVGASRDDGKAKYSVEDYADQSVEADAFAYGNAVARNAVTEQLQKDADK